MKNCKRTYDALDRLVSVTPYSLTGVTPTMNYTETYIYAPIGNFTSENGVTQYYSSTKPRAVTSLSNDALYEYDANGNMTQRIECGVMYWLHGDHLGSASLTTNISGAAHQRPISNL